MHWEGNKCYVFWVCVCSLCYPARNAHAPYCHLWPDRLYRFFPHYLINGTIFEKETVLNTKCVFWFSVQLLTETFLIISINERDMIGKNGIVVCMWRSGYLFQYLTNFMHKICFTISFISCLYMFRAHVLIIRRSKLHYTASGRLVHQTDTYRCNDTRGCVMQFWPPDDEHMCSKHVEAWNKLIVKQILCIKLVNYWDKYTEMQHGQQNVKICNWVVTRWQWLFFM